MDRFVPKCSKRVDGSLLGSFDINPTSMVHLGTRHDLQLFFQPHKMEMDGCQCTYMILQDAHIFHGEVLSHLTLNLTGHLLRPRGDTFRRLGGEWGVLRAMARARGVLISPKLCV